MGPKPLATLVHKFNSSCVFKLSPLISSIRRILAGIDSTGIKITHASQYYTERTGLRRYAKLSIEADVLQQIIYTIKIRRFPIHDNINFRPIITRTNNIPPLSVVIADKGYDIEENHL